MGVGARYWLLVTGIGLLAFALRLVVTAGFQGLSSPPSFSAQPDQVDYEVYAFHLSVGHGYAYAAGRPTAHRPPGTSLTLVPVYLAFGRSFVAARLWFCLLSALTCLGVAWLALQFAGPRASLVSAAWLAVYPGHVYYAMHLLSEVPYGLWITLASGLGLASLRSGSATTAVGAGIFWGLAVLTRVQALLIPAVGLLLVPWVPREMRRRYAIQMCVQLCVVLVVVGPWVMRNTIVFGRPILATSGGVVFWGAHNERVASEPRLRGSWVRPEQIADEEHPLYGSEVEKGALAWQYGIQFVKGNLDQMPRLYAMKLWRLLSPATDTPNHAVFWAFMLGWGMTAPFVYAGWRLMARRNRLATVVVTGPMLATVLVTLIFYGSERLRESIAPLLVIPAAVALAELVDRSRAALGKLGRRAGEAEA